MPACTRLRLKGTAGKTDSCLRKAIDKGDYRDLRLGLQSRKEVGYSIFQRTHVAKQKVRQLRTTYAEKASAADKDTIWEERFPNRDIHIFLVAVVGGNADITKTY